MKSRRVILGAVVLAGVAVLVGALIRRNGNGEETILVRRGDIAWTVVANGLIEAKLEIDLGARIFGRIKSVNVKVGDVVKQGDVVAELESDEISAELERARAALAVARAEADNAKATLDRWEPLVTTGAATPQQVDDARRVWQVAQARVKEAQAQVQFAEARRDATILRAPVGGRITRRLKDPGEVLVPQTPDPVVTIADTSQLYARMEVEDTDVRKIELGLDAVVIADAYPNREFRAKVVQISGSLTRKGLFSEKPTERSDTRVMDVKVRLEEGTDMPVNLPVEVHIRRVVRENVLRVPRYAVQLVDGKATVKRNGQRHEVTVGVTGDSYVEILSGLSEGDRISR